MKPLSVLRPVTFLVLIGGALAAGAQATSDANTSTLKVPAEAKKVSREDIDAEISNARLRATTGAKSVVSLQTEFTYNGSTIADPLAQERPQLNPGNIENDPAKLMGKISGKYRISDHNNLNVGVGVGWITPTYDGQRGQMEDPYIAYGRVFKSGNVQNVINAQLTRYTATSAVEGSKLSSESALQYTALAPVGNTKLQLGLAAEWDREYYYEANNGVQDVLALFPFAEYEFNQRFSLRTVNRGLTYYNTRKDANAFVHDTETQSAGLGISVTRNFYLYPNVQWVWGDTRPEKTNVALVSNINL